MGGLQGPLSDRKVNESLGRKYNGPMASLIRDVLDGILQLALPATCILCNRIADAEHFPVCDSCRSHLAANAKDVCPRCAASVGPFANVDNGCPSCKKQTFRFSQAIRLGPYEGYLRHAILRMKEPAGERIAEIVGAFWAGYGKSLLQSLQIDAIVPIPLHWWRRWRRGYNQSEVLAQALAGGLHLPCRSDWLRRVRNTPRQVEQSAAQRRENVRNAFQAGRPQELKNRNILLVDDVITTGSTVHDAARALCNAGAARVVVAVLAGPHHCEAGGSGDGLRVAPGIGNAQVGPGVS
jgi:competence protein ComFC